MRRMLLQEVLSVMMLVKQDALWSFLDGHAKKGQLLVHCQELWTARLPQSTEGIKKVIDEF